MDPKVVEFSIPDWQKKITSLFWTQAFYYFLCACDQEHAFIVFSEGLLTFLHGEMLNRGDIITFWVFDQSFSPKECLFWENTEWKK
jgi:hypothetical protein